MADELHCGRFDSPELIAARDHLVAALIDSCHDAVIVTTLDRLVLTWNPAAERIFGYTEREVIGQPMSMMIPPTRTGEATELLQRTAAGKPTDNLRTVRRRKDGSYVDVLLTICPLKDNAGEIIASLAVVKDLSREQQMMDALRRSEEMYRVTLSSIGDAVIATDIAGRITFMNPIAEKLTGCQASSSLSKPLANIFTIVNELTRRPVENPVSKVISEGHIVGLANHTALIAKDGTERPISDSAAPIRDASGRLMGVVLVFRDVTDARRAELAVQRLAAIVENSDDAIIGKDLQGLVTSWNRAAERIFGYRATEMVGRSIRVFIPPERQAEEAEILARLQRGERVEPFETVRLTKDGRLIDVSVTVSPIKDFDGNIVGASKIAREIKKSTTRPPAIDVAAASQLVPPSP